jgi:hypothetical protein
MSKRCIDFEYKEISRAEIKSAPYNPRRISDKNRKNLKKSLTRFGMVESIILNKRTGNLVGGHQRLGVLDEKNKTEQYIVGVNVIDIDEKEEKALNIALNNKNLQGEYDALLLGEMKTDIDLKEDGFFDNKDIEIMFGFDDEVTKDLIDDTFSDAMKRMHSAQSKVDEKGEGVNYNRALDNKKLTIIFESNRERDAFDRYLHIDKDDPFIAGRLLVDILREWSSTNGK